MREVALAALVAASFEQIPVWLLVVILAFVWFVSTPGISRRAVLIRLRCWVAQVRRAMRDYLAEAGFGALCVRLSAFLRGIGAAASLKQLRPCCSTSYAQPLAPGLSRRSR